MIRAVFDTNVLASGLVSSSGVPGRLMELWADNAFELIVSASILAELEHTLAKPYFRRNMEPSAVKHTIGNLSSRATVTPLTANVVGIATHAADDLVLAAAISAMTEYIVTGDVGLLSVQRHQGVRILNPRDFLKLLEQNEGPSSET